MTDRILCVNRDCKNTILPVTAELNNGLCMPCYAEIQKRKQDEIIRKNRQEIDEFKGVNDPVEILKIIHKPRKFDPLVNWIPCSTSTEDLYFSLTQDQAESLAEHAAGLVEREGESNFSEILICLAAFTGTSVDVALCKLILKKIFYPSLVFHRCSPNIRDELIQLVNSDEENRNSILCALAWGGDEKVIQQFDEWRNNPPSWRSSLYVGPEVYANQAGWEITADSQRRNLFFSQAFALENGESKVPEDFIAISNRIEICPWCSSTLINLFEFRSSFLGIETDSEKVFKIPTCQICTAFGQFSGVFDENGEWTLCSKRPDYLPDDSDSWDRLPSNPLKLGSPRTVMHSADAGLPTSFSQLGGLPTWEQDAEYPECPKCEQTMMFVAQISRTDIEEYSEGIFYGFICQPCNSTSTTYQQT